MLKNVDNKKHAEEMRGIRCGEISAAEVMALIKAADLRACVDARQE